MLRRSLRYAEELSEAVQKQLALAYRSKDLVAYALRARLRDGYTAKDFRADLYAALAVGAIALPLALALAAAAGVPPQYGLYSAIVAGLAAALLGGSRFVVTGPTAALVAVLVPLGHRFGAGGLLLAGAMAGVLLLVMGLARLGKLVELVPHPVATGLAMGIAVVLAIVELPELLGVALPPTSGTLGDIGALWAARGAFDPWAAAIGAATLALLVLLPRRLPRALVPLVALAAVAVVTWLLAHYAHVHVATIGARFSYPLGGGELGRGIPPLPPQPTVPWAGVPLDYHAIRELLPWAFALAMLGAIESLFAASAADGMTGTRHDPNAELIALGVANVLAPFWGGIAAGGGLARTATNVRTGARSPLAAAMHGVVVLAATIALAPFVAYVPMAALAALVVVFAWAIADPRHFARIVRVGARHDLLAMLVCFALVVLFDIVIAVPVGIVLAALLFMRRMSVLGKPALPGSPEPAAVDVPPGVRLYTIPGPLFFASVKTAMAALSDAGARDRIYILDMRHVHAMDVTGMVALESALDRMRRAGIEVIFAAVADEVKAFFERAGLRDTARLAYAPDLDTAVNMAMVHSARLVRSGKSADVRAGA